MCVCVRVCLHLPRPSLPRSTVHGGLKVYSIGPAAQLTFRHEHLGNNASILADIAAGR